MLDATRGIAVLGILIMNITGFGLPRAYDDPTNARMINSEPAHPLFARETARGFALWDLTGSDPRRRAKAIPLSYYPSGSNPLDFPLIAEDVRSASVTVKK